MKKSTTIILLVFALVLHTLSNQAQSEWSHIATIPTSNVLNDIFFIDNQTGWVVGASGDCYKSTDGGYSWASQSTGVTDNLNSVKFINQMTGYAAGNNGTLVKTVDGGLNWVTLPTGETGLISLLSVVDNKIIIKADSAAYKVSEDAGTTWNWKSLNSTFPVKIDKIQFINNSDGFIAALDLYISPSPAPPFPDSLILFKTTDGGNNWSLISVYNATSLGAYYIYKILGFYFVNQSIGYCSLQQAYYSDFLKTTDGGVTWTNINPTGGGPPVNQDDVGYLYFHNENFGWIWGFDGSQFTTYDIRKTVDGGNTLLESCASSCDADYKLCFIDTPWDQGWGIYGHDVIRYVPLEYKNMTFFSNVVPPSSNINNIIYPDKLVRFKTEIANNLGSNLITLSGVISTTNPYVTITNATGTYNNVSYGSSGWTANEYEIQLASNIPNNEVIKFDMLLNDQIVTGGPWLTSFSFPFVLNPFDMSNNIIDDDNIPDSNGNNNDIVDPGETIEIIPLMDNMTTHSFANIEGYLFSPYPQIHIWNDTMGSTETVYNHYTYGNISSGAQNVPPEKDFVYTNNFTTTYNLPFAMIMTGYISSFNGSNKYQNIEYRWGSDFIMNDGYPSPPPPQGIDEPDAAYKIRVFPNPAKDAITINTGEIRKRYIEIADITGKPLAGWKAESGITTLDVSHFQKGLYLLKIETDKGITFQKLVIE